MKDTMEERKQNMDALNAQVDIIEERITIIEDRHVEMLHTEEKRELRLKVNEESLREISNSIRNCNVRIIGIQEGEEKQNGAKSLFTETIAENFPNLGKEREICVEETSRSHRFVNVKRPTARHIVVKHTKINDTEKILRAARQMKIDAGSVSRGVERKIS
uniref:L1 transposable element RRM domain-containing protein n=1 Tax=Equus caballus TaxID=9796 RepID=A0A9L0RJD7_HORSE